MIFVSDNWAGASEKVLAALVEAAHEGGPAYGGDRLTRAVEARFAEIFEQDACDFAFARQRAGQGHSKNWFIAAQIWRDMPTAWRASLPRCLPARSRRGS